jgi:hypothetical protein
MAVGKKYLDLIFRVDTKKAEKSVDGLGKGIKSVGVSGKIASGGLKLMGGGFKAVGMAMKAAGIGLFIGLLSQLTGMFSENQKIMDTFSRIMLKLKPVFDALGEVIAFVAGVLEDLIDMMMGAINWIGSLIGVTDAAAQSQVNMANEVVQLRNDVKLMNAELALTQLAYQKEAELQRQLRDDTSKSIDERIAANEELGRILEEQFEQEVEMANMALELAEKELALDKSNIDLQVAVIEAKTKLAEIDERITSQRSEQLTNLNGLEAERAAKQKERADAVAEQLAAEAKAYEDIRKEMKKNINAVEEDLSLKGQLKSAADEFAKAEAHLETVLNRKISTEQKANKEYQKEINTRRTTIAQLKKELSTDEDLLQKELNKYQKHWDVIGVEFEDLYNQIFSELPEEAQKEFDFDFINEMAQDLESMPDVLLHAERRLEETIRQSFGRADQALIDQMVSVKQKISDARDELSVEGIIPEEGIVDARWLQSTTMHLEWEIDALQSELDTYQELFDENYTIIENRSAAHQTELDNATKEFNETQKKLKLQAQAVVDQFRRTSQQKEIEDVWNTYQEIIDLTAENSTDRIELIKERDAKIIEINNRDAKALLDTIKKNQDKLAEFNKTAQELEIEAVNAKYQVMLDKAAELGLSEIEIEKMKEEEKRRVRESYAEIEAREQKQRNEATINNALSMMKSLLSISQTKSEKAKKQLDDDLKKELITEQQYNTKLQKIEEDQLRKEKKAALLQIGVDTARGISSAVQAGAGLLFPANLFAITSGIAAVLAGVAQAASVLGQSVEGVDDGGVDGGGDDGGDLSGDVPGIPTFGAIETEAPPIQAYVVESDVTNAQALQSELDLQSTL